MCVYSPFLFLLGNGSAVSNNPAITGWNGRAGVQVLVFRLCQQWSKRAFPLRVFVGEFFNNIRMLIRNVIFFARVVFEVK